MEPFSAKNKTELSQCQVQFDAVNNELTLLNTFPDYNFQNYDYLEPGVLSKDIFLTYFRISRSYYYVPLKPSNEVAKLANYGSYTKTVIAIGFADV